jgi:hypothetical protein
VAAHVSVNSVGPALSNRALCAAIIHNRRLPGSFFAGDERVIGVLWRLPQSLSSAAFLGLLNTLYAAAIIVKKADFGPKKGRSITLLPNNLRIHFQNQNIYIGHWIR